MVAFSTKTNDSSFPQVDMVVLGEGTSLSVPPNYIKGMTHEIYDQGAVNRVTFSLFDPSWGILDLFLQKAKSSLGGHLVIQYRYGWHDDMSPHYRVAVMKVNPGNVSLLGAELSISGTDQGIMDAYTKASQQGIQQQKVYTGNISYIVASIAQSHGWQIDIMVTDPIYDYKGKEGAVERKWVKGRMKDLEFINYLARYARSKKSPGNFVVSLDTDGNGVSTLHFRPREAGELYKSYYVLRENMGEVLSFEPEIDNLNTAMLGASGVEVLGRDPSTREVKRVETDGTKHKNSKFLGSRVVVPPGQVARHIVEGAPEERLKDVVESYYSKLANNIQKATLTVLGDHQVRPGNIIDVNVITPNGQKYFTSGKWLVLLVTSEISGGSFKTTLKLRKNSSNTGSIPHTGPQVRISGQKVDRIKTAAGTVTSGINFGARTGISRGVSGGAH